MEDYSEAIFNLGKEMRIVRVAVFVFIRSSALLELQPHMLWLFLP